MSARVLIVDDQKEPRAVLAEQLERKGYEVSVACDGREAIETLGRLDVDVVLLDVLLPDASGIDVIEKIRQLKPTTEVVFLTGHADMPTAFDGLEKGAFDYVLKPADPDDLLETIRGACELRRLNLLETEGE